MARIEWIDMAGVIPEGKQGVAEIKHCVVSEQDASFSRVRAAATGGREAPIKPGSYAQLFVDRGLMMSDTQMERRSNTGLIWNARGHVLVAGLGIGMVVPPLMAKPEVTKVTIIEKYQDVRDLVEAPLREFLGEDSEKLEVVVADIFDYKPPRGAKYDTIYFDIWPDICTSNLDEMSTLHRKYARRKADKGVYMDSWMKADLKYMARRGW